MPPVRPLHLVVSAWICALLLSVQYATELRQWAIEDDGRAAKLLGPLYRAAVAINDATSAARLHEHLERVRSRLYGVPAADEMDDASPPLSEAPSAPAPRLELALPTSEAPPAGGTATAPPVPPPPPAVSKVLLIGASSMQLALGVALEEELEARGLSVLRNARAATGLSRPDVLDWPLRLEKLLARFHPEAVIINFGGNDATSIPLGRSKWAAYGTEEWDRIYAARVTELVTRVRSHRAHAFVVGMPIMKSAQFSRRMTRLNQITRDAAVAAGGIYLEQWDLAADSKGLYRERLELDGRQHLMRDADGIHYSRWGGRHVARGLLPRIEEHVELRAP